MMTRFDESNANFLIVHEGEEHGRFAEYRAWLGKWTEWLHKSEPFGVILVVHEHEHDEEHERDGAEEDAISRLLNEFRREYRPLINEKTWGFTAVFTPNAVQSWQAKDPDVWSKVQARYAQLATYMWGIRGRAFTNVAEAKAWLRSLAGQPHLPLEMAETETAVVVNQNIGLFYGSTTGTTELVAEKIQHCWQELHGEKFPIVNISDIDSPVQLLNYDHLILGVPTWNVGRLQDDWAIFFPHFDEMDFSGKQVALFGVGDQYGYPENFQDALGILGDKLRERGATLVGLWDVTGYEFDYSRGVENGRFLGLAIDEVSQAELTASRIQQWVAQISQQFAARGIQWATVVGD